VLHDPVLSKKNFGFFRPKSATVAADVLSRSIVSLSAWNANDPMEDRHFCSFDKRNDALLLGVIDGHGKNLCAQVVGRWMPSLLSKALSCAQEHAPPTMQSCALMMSVCFAMCDAIWLDSIDQHTRMLELHRRETSTAEQDKKFQTGACALSVVLTNSFCCVASTGDCRATLFRRPAGSSDAFSATPLAAPHTASNADEYDRTSRLVAGRDRLPIRPSWRDLVQAAPDKAKVESFLRSCFTFASPFPDQDNCYERIRGLAQSLDIDLPAALAMSQRVAGTLMVTRSLGDAYLKDPKYDSTGMYRGSPYIHCLPDVSAFLVDPAEEQVVVLASDGLWDFLSDDFVARLLSTVPASLSD
jgi:serine/threonine protein phosphatase PrpC